MCLFLGGAGHAQRVLAVASALVTQGADVTVFAPVDFAPAVAAAGARFVDVFAGRTIADIDPTSLPVPSRYVTFAATQGERLIAEIGALRPHAVVADSFAVVARLVAERLAVPRVNVLAGHAAVPSRVIAELEQDPRVAISAACHEAVAVLRDRFGMADASPFSYMGPPSTFLNLYGEPEAFLPAGDRSAFEPIAFFGTLPAAHEIAARDARDPDEVWPARRRATRRVYVAFGTISWRYYLAEALAALDAIVDGLAGRDDVDVLVSCGGWKVDPASVAALARPNAQVEPHVDQWQVLRGADVFVTHHGLNSTHEAVYRGVPMISYPFFGDQPGLAVRCQELGLAVPLTAAGVRAPVTPADIAAALDTVDQRRDELAAALARARAWEDEVLAGREEIAARILAAC